MTCGDWPLATMRVRANTTNFSSRQASTMRRMGSLGRLRSSVEWVAVTDRWRGPSLKKRKDTLCGCPFSFYNYLTDALVGVWPPQGVCAVYGKVLLIWAKIMSYS